MTSYPGALLIGQIHSTPQALHHRGRGHDSARHGGEPTVDDVGDQQIVTAEVVGGRPAVPDMGISIAGVRLVLGRSPLPYPLVGRSPVPGLLPISERQILVARDSHDRLIPDLVVALRNGDPS